MTMTLVILVVKTELAWYHYDKHKCGIGMASFAGYFPENPKKNITVEWREHDW